MVSDGRGIVLNDE